MLRQGKAQDTVSSQVAALTLPKAPLPLDELTQLQRRLAHLLSSLAELQDHVANAVSLEEWPWLLSRHVALISQTHSLSLVLSRANPAALHAQLTRFEEAVLQDARENNKFSSGQGADGAGVDGGGQMGFTGTDDALFGGRTDKERDNNDGASSSRLKLPAVQYSDGDSNPLRRIAPHPFYPLDANKSQTVIPSLLLPRGIDNQVGEETQARWEAWLRENAAKLGIEADEDTSIETLARIANATTPATKLHWLKTVREQVYYHDIFASQALVSFAHAREATDELGQRYDWRLRLDPDEDSDEEGAEGEAGDEDGEVDQKADAVMVDALGMPTAAPSSNTHQRLRDDGEEDIDKASRQEAQQPSLSLKQVANFLHAGHT